ncbi:MAG: hypothetical protein WC809_22025 [Sinimarinibacterium sp.]|jgi:plasmid stability protein
MNSVITVMLASAETPDMATDLIVRNVDKDVVFALKRAAATHGRSAEAEHRKILRAALMRPARRALAEVLANMPNIGTEADFDL